MVKNIVIDSSVAVKWVNSEDELFLEQADKILKDSESGKIRLYAPELLKYEAGNALLYKDLKIPFAKASLATLYDKPITFVPLSDEQAVDTLEIAASENITYYDAVFLSLTKNIKATLVTANPKHQKKIPGLSIISLKNYR